MAEEYKLELDVLTKVWRRNLTPDASLFATAAGTDGLSVINGELAVERGHWVRLNAAGEAIAAGFGASAVGAVPVWSGGAGRKDAIGGITAIYGQHVAFTTGFDPTPTNGAYAPAVELTLADDGSGNAILDSAASGNFVVAHVEDDPAGTVSAKFANGLLKISTLHAGYFKP